MKSQFIIRFVNIIVLSILVGASSLFAGDRLSDSLALVALYDSTNGDSWNNKSGWKTDTLEAWYGITVENGRVTRIQLVNNNLAGPIPPQIGDLDSLEWLNLANNTINDSIPAEIGNLINLKILNFSNAKLVGNIPPELGNLTELNILALSSNLLTGSLPSELGNLTDLTTMYINSTQISDSIPASFGNLTNLQNLQLQSNQLSGKIPPEIGNMSSLEQLYLRNNLLTDSIPPELGNLTNLMLLHLNGNQLIGAIPSEIVNLSNLTQLDLSFNQLSGIIPSALGSMSSLRILNLYNNQLSGEIPPELGNLSNIQQLSLNSNNLTGTIPPELGNLTNLQFVELYGNQLTGPIPPELGNLTNVTGFYVSDNQLTGTIPPELGNLSNLFNLHLQSNELSGPVPEELTNLINLSTVFINDNHLEDLPDFSGLPLLTTFFVGTNKFTFGGLEPNIHVLDNYSPQDSIGISDSVYFTREDTIMLVTTTDGLYNNYQWTLNGIDISDNSMYSGANDSLLLIMNPGMVYAGAYACNVTNDTVTGLTLNRRPIYLIPTVKVISVLEASQCADDSITINYKSVDVQPGNIFTVELSDSAGSFVTPIIIRTVSTTDSIGTIRAHIPADMPTSDRYSVRVNASNPAITGLASTNNLEILNKTISAPVIMPSGDSTICADARVLLSTDDSPGLNYIWHMNDTVITGEASYSIAVNLEGAYHVEVFNVCSTDSLPSNIVNISVNPLPIVELSLDGIVLTATQDANYSYVWFLDGDELTVSSTEYQLTAPEDGEYWVEVTDENGCSEESNHQTINVIGIDGPLVGIDIFPNPTSGKINIIFRQDMALQKIYITNIAGKVVFDKAYTNKKSGETIEVDISGQNAGIYMIYIETGSKPVRFKLVKQ